MAVFSFVKNIAISVAKNYKQYTKLPISERNDMCISKVSSERVHHVFDVSFFVPREVGL